MRTRTTPHPAAHRSNARPGVAPDAPPRRRAETRPPFANRQHDNLDLSAQTYRATDWSGATLSNIDFSGCDLRGATFRNAALRNVSFHSARLDDAVFDGAHIARCDLSHARFNGASLSAARIHATLCDHADLTRAWAPGLVVYGAAAIRPCLVAVTLDGARFINTRWTHANLTAANLRRATFSNAVFNAADLTGADLSEARLTTEHFPAAIIVPTAQELRLVRVLRTSPDAPSDIGSTPVHLLAFRLRLMSAAERARLTRRAGTAAIAIATILNTGTVSDLSPNAVPITPL